jgi:hypothetical protein
MFSNEIRANAATGQRTTAGAAVSEEPKSSSWWQTVPGMLTAIAGVISAVALLIGTLHQAGLFKEGPTQPVVTPPVESPARVPRQAQPGLFKGDPTQPVARPPVESPARVPKQVQSGLEAASVAAVPAPAVKCDSGRGDALATDQVKSATFAGYRPGVGFFDVAFEYDAAAHPDPVYIRVTVFSGRQVIAQGFAHTTMPVGQGRVDVATIVMDRMKSEWAEVALCTAGHAIRVYQFPVQAPWLPLPRNR